MVLGCTGDCNVLLLLTVVGLCFTLFYLRTVKMTSILQVSCCEAGLLILWTDIFGLKAMGLERGRL